MEHVSGVIQDCQQQGIKVALDDFGVGYSSLNYLKRLPANILKIDQGFVRDMLIDPDDLAILEGVLSLAATFRREAIAEGVETLEHGRLLLQLGCEYAQGYFMARPMPPEDIPAWILDWQPPRQWKQAKRLKPDERLLVHATTDHRAWVERIKNFVEGKSDSPPPIETGECRFGAWLNSTGKQRYQSADHYQKIIRLHEECHQLGHQLVERSQAQSNDQNRQGLKRLYSLTDQLLELLNQL